MSLGWGMKIARWFVKKPYRPEWFAQWYFGRLFKIARKARKVREQKRNLLTN